MKFIRNERGQTTTEFVMVLPFLLLLFFLIIDFGWLLKNWIVVTNATREAARCEVVQSCTVDGVVTDAEGVINARLASGIVSNISGQEVQVKYIDQDADGEINQGDSVVVCLKADNEYIGPVLGLFSLISAGALPDPMPLAARQEMRIEVPPPGSPSPSGSSSCDF